MHHKFRCVNLFCRSWRIEKRTDHIPHPYVVSDHDVIVLVLLWIWSDSLVPSCWIMQVAEITKSYRWAPFLPIQNDDSMLTVLLLLTKFRLRSIPVIDLDEGVVENMISQSSVVKGLSQCQGRDWFDSLAGKSLHQLGLPVMEPEKVWIQGPAQSLSLSSSLVGQGKWMWALMYA
jgi:hypothetical protein